MADQQMVQSRPAQDEEMGEDQGTPYALRAERNWRQTKYADAGRQNLVLNVWNEHRPWLSYIYIYIYITARVLHLKKTKRVGQMDDWTISAYKIKIVP